MFVHMRSGGTKLRAQSGRPRKLHKKRQRDSNTKETLLRLFVGGVLLTRAAQLVQFQSGFNGFLFEGIVIQHVAHRALELDMGVLGHRMKNDDGADGRD